MKRALPLLLALLLCLCACARGEGNAAAPDPATGTDLSVDSAGPDTAAPRFAGEWKLSRATKTDGTELTGRGLYGISVLLTLREDGTFTAVFALPYEAPTEISGPWSMEGDSLCLWDSAEFLWDEEEQAFRMTNGEYGLYFTRAEQDAV